MSAELNFITCAIVPARLLAFARSFPPALPVKKRHSNSLLPWVSIASRQAATGWQGVATAWVATTGRVATAGAETSAKRFQLGPFHLGQLQSGMLPLSC